MDRVVKEEVADRLEDAAAYINKHGWVQGTTDTPGGRVCVMGAIDRTNKWTPVTATLVAATFSRYLKVAEPERRPGPVAWNDTPGRTQDDVTTHLEKAAVWVREQVA